jgi:type II secretory pathway pseudopilin PulG
MRIRTNRSIFPLFAFALTEALIAVALFGVMFLSLYSGISSGFDVVNLARENVRATQVALEKLETIRMYSWDQVNSNGYIPRSFTAPFYPTTQRSSSSGGSGVVYHGRTEIAPAIVDPVYSNSMREVTITLTWTNGTTGRRREMKTFISEYGMQRYIVN